MQIQKQTTSYTRSVFLCDIWRVMIIAIAKSLFFLISNQIYDRINSKISLFLKMKIYIRGIKNGFINGS